MTANATSVRRRITQLRKVVNATREFLRRESTPLTKVGQRAIRPIENVKLTKLDCQLGHDIRVRSSITVLRMAG